MHAPAQSMSVSGGNSGGGRPAPRIVFSDIDDSAMGLNAEPDYFMVRCFLTHIKTDQRTLWYVACPNCKKKVIDADDEGNQLQGHCEKCGQTVQGARRWIFSANCNDASGNKYVSFFDDQALPLLAGKTADELAPLKHAGDRRFEETFLSNSFKQYVLRCRIKAESYNDEQRLKVSCTNLTPVDFVTEGRAMLEEITKLRQQPAGANQQPAQQSTPGGYQQAPGGYQQPQGGYQQPPGGYQPHPGGYQQPPGGYPQQAGGFQPY